MKKCPRCGFESSDDARFCEECGAAHSDAFDAIYLVDLRGGFNRC